MYLIQVKSVSSEWHYGPFKWKHEAKKWADIQGYREGEYKIIRVIPIIT